MPNELLIHVALPQRRTFDVVLGDLLAEPVDAIVNAANGHLVHGGGVAAAIAEAAGAALVEEGDRIVAEHGPIAIGDAVVTVAGRLPFKGVIHAVGPHQGVGDEGAKLARAVVSACARAAERGWRSVSFPAISSGIFGVPVDVCARAYVAAVQQIAQESGGTSVGVIRLCLFRGPMIKAVRRALADAGLGV